MATTSFHTEEDFTDLVAPDDDLMLERVGRDRRGLRREIAPTNEMARGTREVEEGDGFYADAKSDMPTGTTAVGEALGNVDIVRYTGEDVPIPRMTHSLTIDSEDMEIDNAEEKVQRSMDVLMEQFDIQADLQFLLGITDEEGNQVQPGVFDWLDANIPDDNIINAGDYTSQHSISNGQPSNIVQSVAYQQTEGIYADDGWDMVMWPHQVRGLWNTIDSNSGATLASQWADMDADAAGVGSTIVDDTFLIPGQTGLRTAPDQPDTLQFDIADNLPTATNGANDDVMYLLPDHNGDFFTMHEQPEPTLIQEPIRKEGGQIKYEYYWRGGQAFGLGSNKTDNGTGGNIAHDAIKIENVSALF